MPIFEIYAGRGEPLSLDLDIPEGEVHFVEILPALYDAADAVFARTLKDLAEQGTPAACSAGCAFCCRQLVSVSEDEALLLAAALEALPEEAGKRIRDRFSAVVSAMESAGLLAEVLDVYSNEEHGSETMSEVQRRYAGLNLPCPFLFREKCQVYPLRPMLCREHSVTSRPEECAKFASGHAKVSKVRHALKFATALASFDGLEPDYTKALPLPLSLVMRGRLEKRIRPKTRARDAVEAFLRFAANLSVAI